MLILNHAAGVISQALRVLTRILRLFVVGHVGPVPVLGGIAGEEVCSVAHKRQCLAGGYPLGTFGKGSQSWIDGSCFIVASGHPGEAEGLRQRVVRKTVLIA